MNWLARFKAWWASIPAPADDDYGDYCQYTGFKGRPRK